MKTPNLESTMGLKKTIITTLNSIGVPTNLLGYDYLKTGLEIVLNKPDLIRQVTQVLYPSIAVEHNTTSARVERTIRHAIEVVYERGNFEALEKIARSRRTFCGLCSHLLLFRFLIRHRGSSLLPRRLRHFFLKRCRRCHIRSLSRTTTGQKQGNRKHPQYHFTFHPNYLLTSQTS